MKPPIGTVTFLFTDIEGSTQLWERHESEMREALRTHNGILDDLIKQHGGFRFGNPGDGYCVAFDRADVALAAAIGSQRRFHETMWPERAQIRVRMAIHTGSGEYRDSNYLGRDVNRAQRVMETAHGGCIVLSGSAAELVKGKLPAGCSLEPQGRHLLRDLLEPDDLYSVRIGELPADMQPLRSLTTLQHNLPHMLTSFVDRETELVRLEGLLRFRRMVTIIGPGGCGKTRLALQAAAHSVHLYSGGALFVDFSGLVNSELVPETVLASFGKLVPTHESASTVLARALRDEDRLVILDNCEHVLSGVKGLVGELLNSGVRSTFLVTSRIPLGIRGEQMLTLGGLQTEIDQTENQCGSICPAVRLFLERAQEVLPDFQPNTSELSLIKDTCAELDGIPLAIELATTRLGVMTPGQLYARLSRRMELLRDPCSTKPGRHRTLEATIDWSCSLMSDVERKLFVALAVFPLSFTAEAVEAVFADFDNPLGILESLVRQSMVQFRQDDGRFRLLGSVRSYALDRWQDKEDRAIRFAAHRDYYANLATQYSNRIHTEHEQVWLSKIDAEVENLRQAISAGEVKSRLETAVLLHRYWWVYGRLAEAETVLSCLIRAVRSERTLLVGDAYNALGHIHSARKRTDKAFEAYAEAHSIYIEHDEPAKVAASVNNLGNILLDQCRFHEARDAYRSAAQVFESMGDDERTWIAKLNAAAVGIELGELDEAEEVCADVLSQSGFVNPVSIAAASVNLVEIALRRNDQSSVRTRLLTSVQMAHSTPSTLIELQIETRAARFAALCGDCPTMTRWINFADRRVQEIAGSSLESFDNAVTALRNCTMESTNRRNNTQPIRSTEEFYEELTLYLTQHE